MKLLVLLAEGFEEVEALTVVDYFRRVGGEALMVSTSGEKEVRGAHNIRLLADETLDNLKDLDSYAGVIIPGGLPGATNLRDNEKVIEILRQMNDNKKLIGAICAGPIVLEKAGIVKGRKLTFYPGFEDQLESANYLEDKLVIDGNIITSRGPALAVDFALGITKYLLGDSKEEELRESILYDRLFKK